MAADDDATDRDATHHGRTLAKQAPCVYKPCSWTGLVKQRTIQREGRRLIETGPLRSQTQVLSRVNIHVQSAKFPSLVRLELHPL